MVKDFSNVPADVVIKNETENDITIRVHFADVCIPANNEVKVRIETSEELIAVTHRLEDTGLVNNEGSEPVDPEITSVNVNPEAGLFAPIEVGTKVATITVEGGTEPFTYSANGGADDGKFNIESEEITTKEQLEENTYTISVKVTDNNGKENSTEGTITVGKAEEVEVQDAVQAVTKIKTDFFNKKQGEKITIDNTPQLKEEYYSELGDCEEVEMIKIANTIFNKDEIKYVSVGQNSFIEAPVYIVEEAKLKVAPLFLMGLADTEGKVNVVAGDKCFAVTLDGFSESQKELKITKATPLNTQQGKKNDVNFQDDMLTMVSNDGRHMVGLTVSEDGSELTDREITIYRIDEDNNMGVTTPESNVTYAIAPKWKNGSYTEEDVVNFSRKQKLLIVGKGIVEFTIDFTAEEYVAKVSEIFKARDGEEYTFNKQIKDLQENIEFTDTEKNMGKVTGTIKYITDYTNTAYTEGNVISIHIDNTKLPKGTVKYVFGQQEANPDTKDWNVNLKLKEQEDRNFQIKIDGEVLVTLDLSELTLMPNVTKEMVKEKLNEAAQQVNTKMDYATLAVDDNNKATCTITNGDKKVFEVYQDIISTIFDVLKKNADVFAEITGGGKSVHIKADSNIDAVELVSLVKAVLPQVGGQTTIKELYNKEVDLQVVATDGDTFDWKLEFINGNV